MKLIYKGKVMEEIIGELKERKIPFEYLIDKNSISVEGFSKSGNALLTEDEMGIVTAETRYNRKDILSSFHDLVKLNVEWYEKYKSSYKKTSSFWNDSLNEYYLLNKRT